MLAPTPTTPTMIMPECAASGCAYEGDQMTMARCRRCGHWFCPEHISHDRPVDAVRAVSPGLSGLTFYVGYCADCAKRAEPLEDEWLR